MVVILRTNTKYQNIVLQKLVGYTNTGGSSAVTQYVIIKLQLSNLNFNQHVLTHSQTMKFLSIFSQREKLSTTNFVAIFFRARLCGVIKPYN